MKKDGRYTCEPFEFPVASLDEVFVFHLGIVNLQDTFAKGLLLDQKLKELKTATPRELVAAIFQDEWNQAKILPVLWYLVAVGEIGADLNLPLTMNSTLWRKR